jgi:hypothetical protein
VGLLLFWINAGVFSKSIWILENDLPGAVQKTGIELQKAFQRKQVAAELICAASLEQVLAAPSPESLLILTDCGVLPLKIAQPLEKYLDQGGRLLSLGGTLFRKPIGEIDGQWLTEEQYQERWVTIPLGYLIEDFQGEDLSQWSRSSNEPSHPSTHEIIQDPVHGACLHRLIRDMNGWDTLYAPPLAQPIPADQRFTCFWAKGGPKTDRMLIEWEEKDGSRWIAVVTLTTQWKRYVLTEKDFRFWESVPARANTTLNLQNTHRYNVGLAQTHTGGLWGDHEFWFTELGTCSAEGVTTLDWQVQFKPREMLFPAYHRYPCEDVARITLANKQGLLADLELNGEIMVPTRNLGEQAVPPTSMITVGGFAANVQALHPRPQNTGYGKNRTHRWIPLLEATSPTGDYRGAVAALRFTPQAEQMWAVFAMEEPRFYLDSNVQEVIVNLAQRMLETVFLWEGGTSRYTYYPDQFVNTTAQVVADEANRTGLQVEIRFTQPETGQLVWKEVIPARLAGSPIIADEVPLKTLGDYRVEVSLLRAGKVIDRLSHEVHLWSPDPNLPWVTTSKGEFRVSDQLWYPYGVNYMPSSGIAREEYEPFEQWLGARGYDPEVIERDLSRVAGMGMNMVSVFLYHQSNSIGNLVDLLRLCEKYHLRVNLSLRPGTPLDFEWAKVREMIIGNRLIGNRSLFAYDLAWEPHFEGSQDRSRYTREWNDWIQQKYGGNTQAFDAWKYQLTLVDGMIPVPQSREWYEKGPWDHYCLDYGDFLNALLHQYYKQARDLVRSVDPNHAVSFRMQHSGDPTYWGPTWIPYDFRGVARAVDIFEPEGYGRIGGWEQIKGGRFTVDYGRAVNPELPVFWAEAGLSCWDLATHSTPLRNLESVAEFYRLYHRMLLESHSNGVSWWWYPGGFRTGENSDYGIINPDGTDRPVTRVIRELGPQVVGQTGIPPPDTWIEIDMRTRPGGLAGVYASVTEQYWQAIEAGKKVGLKIK